jgi:adenosine deaminase
VLQTDDVGVFCSPCSNEYVVVATHFGLSRLELWELSLQAIDVIFGDEAKKAALRQSMVDWKEKEGL